MDQQKLTFSKPLRVLFARLFKGICDGIDVVISSIGITRQKDGLTYMDVDYQGNKNLLDRAVENKVLKFVYVSVINAHLMKDLKIIQAKERFVDELKESGLAYAIIRPNGKEKLRDFFEQNIAGQST